MQNLLVFKVKSEERRMKNSNAFHVNDKAQIDSILRTNMLGETDSMYMVIPVLSERGIWEMKGMPWEALMSCIAFISQQAKLKFSKATTSTSSASSMLQK